MKKEWLEWISISIAISATLLLLAAIGMAFNRPAHVEIAQHIAANKPLPTLPFKQPQTSYEAIGQSVVEIKTHSRHLQLPDLRRALVYHGKNSRPDIEASKVIMQFAFAGSKTTTPVLPDTKYYLIYDKSQTPARYNFSLDNSETALWFEASTSGPQNKEACIKVGMVDDQGQLLTQPSAHANFMLVERPLPRTEASSWELGKLRVDGTLLARQKARWYGLDCFFERHGGKEYQTCLGKQRLDFGEGDSIYSVFIQLGELLTWKNDRWHTSTAGKETIGKPLLVVTKIDERLMTLELWDPEGKSKTMLNLLKSTDAIIPPNILQNFKFVGAKTRSQFVFEYNKERLTLRPNDWLLFADNQAKLLKSIDDIDGYVERKLQGFLLTFDALEKKDDRQVLIGTIFNRSRTAMQPIELLMQPGEIAAVRKEKPVIKKEVKTHTASLQDDEDDDEDDDDDDDDDEGVYAPSPYPNTRT